MNKQNNCLICLVPSDYHCYHEFLHLCVPVINLLINTGSFNRIKVHLYIYVCIRRLRNLLFTRYRLLCFYLHRVYWENNNVEAYTEASVTRSETIKSVKHIQNPQPSFCSIEHWFITSIFYIYIQYAKM